MTDKKVIDIKNRRPYKRYLSGADTSRLSSSWTANPLPADQIIDRNHRIMVARSREQCANNGYARSFLRMCDQNIVGPKGVALQCNATTNTGTPINALNSAIETAWKQWGKAQTCDVLGVSSWFEYKRQGVRTVARDGEALVAFVIDQSSPYLLKLQMIDPQRVPINYNETKLKGGGFIRHGIEFDSVGRVVAYYITKQTDHVHSYNVYNSSDYQRIDADHVLHLFERDLVDQKRGLPWTSSSLLEIRNLGEFESASLKNAVISAKQTGTIEWADGYGPPDYDDDDLRIELEDGTYWELPAGARLNDNVRNYVGNDFSPFQKSQLRRAAAGLGVAYNNLANDLENVNYSSIRQGALDEREMWKTRQEWFIENFCQPIFEKWLQLALLNGAIKQGSRTVSINRYDQIIDSITWQPRRWNWIDPNSEVKAATTSVEQHFTSVSQVVRDSGRDPQQVFAEIAKERELMQSLGITAQQAIKPNDNGGDDAETDTAE